MKNHTRQFYSYTSHYTINKTWKYVFHQTPKPADFGELIFKPLSSLSRDIKNVIYEIQGKYKT